MVVARVAGEIPVACRRWSRHCTGRITSNPASRKLSTRCCAQTPARKRSAWRESRPAAAIDWRRTATTSSSESSSWSGSNSISPILAARAEKNKIRTEDGCGPGDNPR